MIAVRLLCGLLLLVAVSCAGPSSWASPTPQRPTVASDTNLTAAGTVELESGINFEASESFDVPSTLKLGLAESAEAFVGFSPQRSSQVPGPNPRGAGDVLIGARMKVFEEDGFAGAVQLATRVPGGNGGESSARGESDFFGAAIVSRQIESVSFVGFYQLGLIGDEDDDSMFAEHTIAGGLGMPATETVGVFGELAGIFRPDLDSNILLGTAGATWAVAQNITLDAAAQLGLSDDAPDYQLLVGITWNLGGMPPSSANTLPPIQPQP